MSFGKFSQPRIVILALVFSSLAACATTAPSDTWSPAAASQIRTIALLEITEPDVDVVLHRGEDKESHSTSYAQALASAQIRFSPLLTEALTRQLERSQYQVLPITGESLSMAADGRVDLSRVHADTDAILAVRFVKAGYVSASASDLQPLALVEIRLFDARSGQLLYTRLFNAGYQTDVADAVQLATQPRFRFDSAEQLTAQIDDSAAGIKDAELAIAGAVGRDFSIGSRPQIDEVEVADESATPPQSAAERDQQAANALAVQWLPSPASSATATAPVPLAASADTMSAAPQPPAVDPQQTATASVAAEPPATAPAVDSLSPATGESATQAVSATEIVAPAAAPASEASVPSAATDAPAAMGAPTSSTNTEEVSEMADAASVMPVAAAVSSSVAEQARDQQASDGLAVILRHDTSLRAAPTMAAESVVRLPAGTGATRDARVIDNASGSWCYLSTKTGSGWVLRDAIEH